MTEDPATWPNDIYLALKTLNVVHVPYVPDAGHSRLIELCLGDNEMCPVSLTTEEEGVAMLAGSWLGGKRGALLMQSAGGRTAFEANQMVAVLISQRVVGSKAFAPAQAS